MKIVDNKLVFEVVPCNMCYGSGKSKRGIYCKNENRKQRGKPCGICGSKNKHDHKIVDHYIVDCYFCNGQGERLEDKFCKIQSQLVEPIIDLITFTFVSPDMRKINLDTRFLVDCYTRKNSFAGSQDYTDHTKSSPDTILAKVLKQVRNGYTHQALNYIDAENNLILDVHYWGFNGGFTAQWADEKTQVSK